MTERNAFRNRIIINPLLGPNDRLGDEERTVMHLVPAAFISIPARNLLIPSCLDRYRFVT